MPPVRHVSISVTYENTSAEHLNTLAAIAVQMAAASQARRAQHDLEQFEKQADSCCVIL